MICHLGNGCSASAVHGGKAVDTTMGFTPLEGLMMGTRAGSVDPGILTFVQHEHGLSAEQVDGTLNRVSGLRGVSGVSSDYRQVEAAAATQVRSRLALEIYARRVRAAIGALDRHPGRSGRPGFHGRRGRALRQPARPPVTGWAAWGCTWTLSEIVSAGRTWILPTQSRQRGSLSSTRGKSCASPRKCAACLARRNHHLLAECTDATGLVPA